MHKRFDFCILGGAVDIYVIDIQIIRIDLPCGFTPIPVSAPLIDMIWYDLQNDHLDYGGTHSFIFVLFNANFYF